MNMNHVFKLTFAAAAIATSLGAQADIVTAQFSGSVLSQTGTSFATGAAITGAFSYDTATSSYLSFTIGGTSPLAGWSSIAAITPDQFTALYSAQVSAVTSGGNVNSTYTLDLEALTSFATTNAIGLLRSSGLAANLDQPSSSFSFYTANADGTNVRQLTASLLQLSVSAVPEPAVYELALAGAALIALRLARRRQA